MTEESVGRLLPKITVMMDNDPIETDSYDVEDDVSVKSKVEIVRPSVENLQGSKIYFNKDGGFATCLNLIEQENSGILSRRAERFGLSYSESKPSIRSLYDSMGIDLKNRDSPQMRHIRLDAIHVRGVEELETDDVFLYFQDYGPSSIEWINDCCCNVLWFDEESCARALLGLSEPLPASFPLDLLAPDRKKKKESEKTTSELDDEDKMDVDDASKCEIPVPPGLWRLGVPHELAKAIVLRFANTGDKKVPGAEKRSKFYKKYGNPNYGGLKGYISSSRKHKVQAAANRRAVQKGSSSYKSSYHRSDSFVPRQPRPKTVRMRMYADEEELKVKKIRYKGLVSDKKKSVHSRLGRKYTKDDLCYLGSRRDSDKFHYRMHDDRSSQPEDSYYSGSHRDSDEYDYNRRDFRDSKPKNPTRDLRFKLKNRHSKSHNASSTAQYSRRAQYSRESPEENVRSYDRMHNKRVDDLKRDYRSFYKRKHRSPLCEDDDDDDDDETSSSDD